MIVQTSSGSIYEVDLSRKMIRRLCGNSDVTPLFGRNLEWRSYDSLHIDVGSSMNIIWKWEDVGESIAAKVTTTSPVQSVSL